MKLNNNSIVYIHDGEEQTKALQRTTHLCIAAIDIIDYVTGYMQRFSDSVKEVLNKLDRMKGQEGE